MLSLRVITFHRERMKSAMGLMSRLTNPTPTALAAAIDEAKVHDNEAAVAKTVRQHQETFLQNISELSKFTPDIGKIEGTKRWLLFVPDECMRVHYDVARLGNSALHVCNAVTEDTFTLWKQRRKRGANAIPLRIQYGKEAFYTSPTAAIRLPVMGELWFVSGPTLIKLDHHRENGVRFTRERVKVRWPYTRIQLSRKGFTDKAGQPVLSPTNRPLGEYIKEEIRLLSEPVDVWMYVGISAYWEKHLDGGHTYALMRQFKPYSKLLSPYYFFTPEEYDNT